MELGPCAEQINSKKVIIMNTFSFNQRKQNNTQTKTPISPTFDHCESKKELQQGPLNVNKGCRPLSLIIDANVAK